MGAMASQITRLTIAYWSVYSSADQRKHQSSASLAFVRGIHRWPVNSPYKRSVTRKMLPFDDVIMVLAVNLNNLFNEQSNCQRFDTPLRSYDLTVINNIKKIYHEYQVISKLYGYSSHFLSVLRLDIEPFYPYRTEAAPDCGNHSIPRHVCVAELIHHWFR